MANRSVSGEGLGLRERIIEAASKVFVEEGYQSLSMRRVAQEVGCSQMAMYRHFANKEALTQHICSQLYTRFAAKMNREIDAVTDPWERCCRFVAATLRFAVNYPDHYSLIFLVRHSNPEVLADRERLGQEFLAGLHVIVRALLPPGTPEPVIGNRPNRKRSPMSRRRSASCSSAIDRNVFRSRFLRNANGRSSYLDERPFAGAETWLRLIVSMAVRKTSYRTTRSRYPPRGVRTTPRGG
jgi:AcrR family transcriptional regulator